MGDDATSVVPVVARRTMEIFDVWFRVPLARGLW
jgi:hypothetical protein